MAAVNAGELFLEGGVVCLVWVWVWFLLKSLTPKKKKKSLMPLYGGGGVCETKIPTLVKFRWEKYRRKVTR